MLPRRCRYTTHFSTSRGQSLSSDVIVNVIKMATAGCGGEKERAASSTSRALKNPFVGNVSKFVSLPPSEQKAANVKKGRLQFDACFESSEPHPSFRRERALAQACVVTFPTSLCCVQATWEGWTTSVTTNTTSSSDQTPGTPGKVTVIN